MHSYKPPHGQRSVAQPGSAPDLGSGGRRFESSRSDHHTTESACKITLKIYEFNADDTVITRYSRFDYFIKRS